TYTKAMGEQAIAASGCRYALVRPAIVESALRFPFPGWNEGFTTSAPLVFMGLNGQRVFPAGHKRVLDLIPVDLVAAGILGVAGAACAGRLHHRVFQLASGDVNPIYVRRAVERVALYKLRQLAMLETTWDLFLPFVAGERFIFQCKHTRELWAQLSEGDRARLPWDPEGIDWRQYWMEVHMRGLEEWVFPGLEEERKALKREVPQPKDLLALLAASVHAFGPRVALRFYAGEDGAPELARTRDDRITYDELARFSARAARALQANGVKPGDRVLLMSENRPEWAMGYFGMLKAGAAAAPLDQGLSAQEVGNCAQAAKAAILLASPRVAQRP